MIRPFFRSQPAPRPADPRPPPGTRSGTRSSRRATGAARDVAADQHGSIDRQIAGQPHHQRVSLVLVGHPSQLGDVVGGALRSCRLPHWLHDDALAPHRIGLHADERVERFAIRNAASRASDSGSLAASPVAGRATHHPTGRSVAGARWRCGRPGRCCTGTRHGTRPGTGRTETPGYIARQAAHVRRPRAAIQRQPETTSGPNPRSTRERPRYARNVSVRVISKQSGQV